MIVDQQRKTKIKKQLSKLISNDFKEDKVCVLLSGGSDSTLISLICKSLGKKVVSVSFELEGMKNWDCDKSEEISKRYGFEFHKVIVPNNNPKDWFLKLIKMGCSTKIQMEVLYPTLFMLDKVKSLGFKKVLSGFSNPIPDGRGEYVEFRKNHTNYWNKKLKEKYDSIGTQKVFEVSKGMGIEIFQYLNHSSIIDILKDISTIQQLDKPYHKHYWKDCFKKEFEECGLLKGGITFGLQNGGNIESFFKPLLSDPYINYNGYVRGIEKNRLSMLVKLWSSNPNPKIKPYPIIIKHKPYTMKEVKKQSSKKLFSVVTTFSGGGGSSTGYKLGGGDVLLMNEFIEEGVKTYLENYPNTPYEMVDIRKISRRGGRDYVISFFKKYGIEVGGFDILDGSPPCSTFSSSGKGKEKIEQKNVKYSETEQSRIGMLIHDFVYINNCMKPKVCIIENVPPIKSSDVFQHSLERIRRWGYKVNYDVICSSNFGVPQRRNRLIVIGIRGDVCKEIGLKKESEILELYPKGSIYEPTIEEGLKDVEVNPNERKMLLMDCIKSSTYELIKSIPKNPITKLKMNDLDPNWLSDFNLVRSSFKEPSPTLTQMGQQLGRGGIFHPNEDRLFTSDELKSLMGLPTDYILTGNFNQKSERCGRMVTPPIYKYLSESIYEKVLKPTKHLEYDISKED